MDIKVLRSVIVGSDANPVNAGEVAKSVDDAEAKALIAMGFAEEVKSKGNAPENKAAGNPLADVLAGSVAEITAQLDGFNVDELRILRDLEAAGQKRKGVADAINAYDLG